MIYRCLNCDYEEARGCLPTVSCGLYFVFLALLLLMCCYGVLFSLSMIFDVHTGSQNKLISEGHSESQAQTDIDWWVFPASVIISPVLYFICFIGLHWMLEWIEFLAFYRRKCPVCGGRRWSRGFTRGFGL